MRLLGRSKTGESPSSLHSLESASTASSQEALIKQVVAEQFEIFRHEQEARVKGAVAELMLSKPLQEQENLSREATRELLDRVEQLEARLEKLGASLEDRYYVPRIAGAPAATNVKVSSPDGSPLVVETVLSNGMKFQTPEPPEMRAGAQVNDSMGVRAIRCAAPVTSPPATPSLKYLTGPQWGVILDEDLPFAQAGSSWQDQRKGSGLSAATAGVPDPGPHGGALRKPQRRVEPWDREPDEGSLEDGTATWLWRVDIPRDGSTGRLGIEVCHHKDTDNLVVTRVKEGLLAQWNMANARRSVEPGDVVVSVDNCEECARAMLKILRKATSLTIRRDMASWYRLKATRMGYVEQLGRHLPGKTY